ncbi:UbiA family prenyltransferase [Haladaptatus sp. DJG-WS-42]|uniref:UbiA family prenyltransferase n=1 Tax=Haladaptatus sp. DJG-WS-42 TaxID=3120516 RepID=UPI0030D5B5B9
MSIRNETATKVGAQLHNVGTAIKAPESYGETKTQLYNVVVHGTLFLGLVGATKIYVVATLLSLSLNPAVIIAFLVSFTVYSHNKLTDLNEDAVNNPDRVAFIKPKKRLFIALSAGAYVLALIVSLFGGIEAFLLTLFPGVSAILYSEPVLPFFEADRLKEILLVNTSFVAVSWAVPVAFLPLAFAGRATTSASLLVFGFFFIRTFIAGEVLNVRDVEGDRREGITTLPVLVGVKRTQMVLYGLDALSLCLIVGASVLGVFSPVHGFALVPAIAYSACITTSLGADVNFAQLEMVRDFEYFVMALSLSVVVFFF